LDIAEVLDPFREIPLQSLHFLSRAEISQARVGFEAYRQKIPNIIRRFRGSQVWFHICVRLLWIEVFDVVALAADTLRWIKDSDLLPWV
jgi:hypothetical protein